MPIIHYPGFDYSYGIFEFVPFPTRSTQCKQDFSICLSQMYWKIAGFLAERYLFPFKEPKVEMRPRFEEDGSELFYLRSPLSNMIQ
jgi:hypothetical protein